MRIVKGQDQAGAVSFMVDMIFNHLKEYPRTVIGVATGNTMVPVYAELTQKILEANLDLSQVKWFALDEYVGVPQDHPSSFRFYLLKNLIRPLKLKESSLFLPEVGSYYDEMIQRAGGIDLQMLGVGVNGHIGFNEPGSGRQTRTRKVKLDTKTLESNRLDLKGLPEIPTEAVSMGVGTILEAKKILLLATGHSKREAIHHLMRFEDREDCPVTFLKSHNQFTLIADPPALPEEYLKI